jgi:hypothetical protein
MSNDGGAIVMQDGRVSKIFAWVAVTIGGALVSGIWIAANNLFEINRTLAQDVIYKQWVSQQITEMRSSQDRNLVRDSEQEDHINSIDRRLVVVEEVSGVNTRGKRRGP